MRSFLATLLIAMTSVNCSAEELYQQTLKHLGSCYAPELSVKWSPPERIRERLKEKCGALENKVQEQFLDFVANQVGKPLTPQAAFMISAYVIASPDKQRKSMEDAYISVLRKGTN